MKAAARAACALFVSLLCALFVSLPCAVLGYLWRAASLGFRVGVTAHDKHDDELVAALEAAEKWGRR